MMNNINSVLLNLGFLPNKAAFIYIKAFIELPEISSFSSALNKIAEENDSNFHKVYDSIRRAIILAANCGKLKNIDKYFNIDIYDDKQPMSVYQFLSIIKLLFNSDKNTLSA